jgi:hypothetical protein
MFLLASNRFSLSKKEEHLRELNERIAKDEAERRGKADEIESLQEEVDKHNKLLGNKVGLQRNIVDNLQYRETVAAEKEVKEEIEKMEERLVRYGELPVLESDLKRALGELQHMLSEVSLLGLKEIPFIFYFLIVLKIKNKNS